MSVSYIGDDYIMTFLVDILVKFGLFETNDARNLTNFLLEARPSEQWKYCNLGIENVPESMNDDYFHNMIRAAVSRLRLTEVAKFNNYRRRSKNVRK